MEPESNNLELAQGRELCWCHAESREQWEPIDGGDWAWEPDGVRVRGTGPEWIALRSLNWSSDHARSLSHFSIQVTVTGKAGAAGLSFGAFKDFLVALDHDAGPHRLELEIGVAAGCWAFRIDGRLMRRAWWDSAVHSVDDLLAGELRLKVRYADDVRFQDLKIQKSERTCQLSVIITCYRFLQRMRVSLRNWCHQDLDSDAYEVLVVNPKSPDGTHEHVSAVARAYPHLRVHEITMESEFAMNKGAMINRAIEMSRGEWIWLTDADCVFGPNVAANVLSQINGQTSFLYFGERRFLSTDQTDALLSGRIDALKEFDELASATESGRREEFQWGYTQIVHRSTLAQLRYTEEFNHFAHSDGMFAEACKRIGVKPRQIPGLFCLHLDHPFSWYGSEMFL
jgi:glycosyl transferase family 2